MLTATRTEGKTAEYPDEVGCNFSTSAKVSARYDDFC
jgi:hypothetical protein